MPKHLPKSIPPVPQQPTVVKYVQPSRIGIQSHTLTRHCIGYIRRGTKYIYYGDVRHAVGAGEVFYLSAGTHYTEDVPTGSRNFEQVVFYYTSEQLARILNNLSLTYQLAITNDHSCPECEKQSHVVAPGWPALKNFFSTINAGLRDNLFADDDTAVHLKLTELVYLILSQGECCLKSKILSNMDLTKENFEQIVHNSIFTDISIEELAAKCNRSLTSFKKEFRKHFFEPPHKWFIRQRLMHSRLLLISTNKSISEIGLACNFPNTSHFIKLFKKEYGMTPAAYRNRHQQNIAEDDAGPRDIPAERDGEPDAEIRAQAHDKKTFPADV